VIHPDAIGEGHVRRQARLARGTRCATLWPLNADIRRCAVRDLP
jgi:hypothetical protein